MTTVPHPRTSPEGLEGYSFGELSFIWRLLDAGQRAYVTRYYERMRDLNEKATAAFKKRSDRAEYLKDYCRANGYTEFNTREKIEKDWTFNDANDDWLRYCREIRRCEVAIDTELKMTALIRGGTGAR